MIDQTVFKNLCDALHHMMTEVGASDAEAVEDVKKALEGRFFEDHLEPPPVVNANYDWWGLLR